MLRKKAKNTTKKISLEQNEFDKLIRDEVSVLNNLKSDSPAYAFTKEQCDEIVRRCKYRVKVFYEEKMYVIKRW